MKKRIICSSIICATMVSLAVSAFSQNSQDPAKEDQAPVKVSQTAAIQAPQAVPAQETVEVKESSIYGEVQAVNAQAASMTTRRRCALPVLVIPPVRRRGPVVYSLGTSPEYPIRYRGFSKRES